MKTPLILLAASLLCACVCGCMTTTSLSRLKPIPIPDGLTVREAVAGAVVATDPSRLPARWTDMDRVRAYCVAITLGAPPMGFVDAYKTSHWRVEEVGEDYAVLGLTVAANKHYARVRYSVRGSELFPKVIDADNLSLNRSKTRMHRNAVNWINRNIPVIREGMWQVKAVKEGATAPDAALRVRKAAVPHE